jgi:CRISPR-associated protein Csm5
MNANIEILTPVHIGSGEMGLRDLDFVIEDNKLIMLDLERMMAGLGPEAMSDWAVDVANGKQLKDLMRRYLPGKTERDFQAAVYPLYHNDKRVSQLKTAMKTLGRPMIPGSSLKGAVRTMLLAHAAGKLPAEPSSVFYSESVHFKTGKKIAKVKDDSFQKRIFGVDPNHDIMRFLQVTDSVFQSSDIEVREALILNHSYDYGWHYKRGLSMLYECLSAGKTSQCRLQWSDRAFNLGKKQHKYNDQSIQPENLVSLLQLAHERMGLVLAKEIKNWRIQIEETEEDSIQAETYLESLEAMQEIYNNCRSSKDFLLRVGSHSGWNFTTGSWIFQRIPEKENSTFYGLSDHIQKKSYGNQYAVFPKTRKVLAGDLLPGFIKLTLK